MANDVEASIPRTPAQAVLRIVSIVMGLLGALAAVGGVLVLLADPAFVEAEGWTVTAFGVIVLAVAVLLLVTATLGLRAADDAARVEPYRFLCYSVGLATLVAIVWAWGTGSFILFDPVVLIVTVVYVLICSTLADKVADERDHGVRGETFLRSQHQRTLHLLAEMLVVKGVLVAAVVAALVASGQEYEAPAVILGVASAVVDLLMGCLGVWGSNRPEKIGPFMAIAIVAVVYDVAQLVAGGVQVLEVLLDLLFMGTCAWLAWKIRRQGPLVAYED